MKSEVAHKKQLAISVAKGKKIILQQVLADYVVRWREHAFRQGVDPDKPPRTIYNDIITQKISELDDEIDVLTGNVITLKGGQSE